MTPLIPEPRNSTENAPAQSPASSDNTPLRMPGIRALYLRMLAEDDDEDDGPDRASTEVA